jgi:lipid-binding SYLF domain-containing protein
MLRAFSRDLLHALVGRTKLAFEALAKVALLCGVVRRSEGNVSLEGSNIRPDNDANERIYGEKISAKDIVIAHDTHVPLAAEALISTLNAKTPKHKSS